MVGLQKPQYLRFLQIKSLVLTWNYLDFPLKNYNYIIPDDKIQITRNIYYDILSLFASIGGIASFLKGVIYLSIAYFIRNQWYDSLYHEIQRKTPAIQHDEIPNNIRHRVSFGGIYILHDKVGELEQKMKTLEKDNVLEQKKTLSLENLE